MFLQYLILAPILIISLSVHELSHGITAYWLGDDTAKRAGRLTLNPLAHIDWLGLIALFIVHIGWAKPVPINPYNFKNYKRDTAITAAAGPVSNFIMAVFASLLLRFILNYGMSVNVLIFAQILKLTVFYNLALGLFNLIPFPPLDGSKIIGGFLSHRAYAAYTAQEKKGMQIFMIIMMLSWMFHWNLIGSFIDKPLHFLLKLLIGNIPL
ncbi:MAG: site-2 protease family protein [Candidatus Cloacimonadota bacterium]|nr:MAG: site-2 protease family protein [Candidatus Cloacimonadota bacterium]